MGSVRCRAPYRNENFLWLAARRRQCKFSLYIFQILAPILLSLWVRNTITCGVNMVRSTVRMRTPILNSYPLESLLIFWTLPMVRFVQLQIRILIRCSFSLGFDIRCSDSILNFCFGPEPTGAQSCVVRYEGLVNTLLHFVCRDTRGLPKRAKRPHCRRF